MTRPTLLKIAGLAPLAPTYARATPAESPRNLPPQKITKIETFILRDPPDRDKPESHFVSMTPIGRMTDRKGLGYRLEHAETVRQGGYSQTLLVKVTTDQGLYGWGESHAVMTPRVVQTAITDLFTPILLGENALDVRLLLFAIKVKHGGRRMYTWKLALSVAIVVVLWYCLVVAVVLSCSAIAPNKEGVAIAVAMLVGFPLLPGGAIGTLVGVHSDAFMPLSIAVNVIFYVFLARRVFSVPREDQRGQGADSS